MQSSLKAILFDADGVIQRPAIDYRSALAAVVPLQGEALTDLLVEIFAAERPALTGHGDFTQVLTEVLARWNLASRVEEALEVWTSIETDRSLLESIAALRSLGIRCCLATNQQAYRGGYMSEALRYCDVFDDQFYSYRMGVAKPARAYFLEIGRRLGLEPSEILFIDDHEPNVAAAREVGFHGALFPAAPADSVEALRSILSLHGVVMAGRSLP